MTDLCTAPESMPSWSHDSGGQILVIGLVACLRLICLALRQEIRALSTKADWLLPDASRDERLRVAASADACQGIVLKVPHEQ